MKTKQRKLILSYWLAKELLNLNYKIIDILPNNYNNDRTVFVFLDNGTLDETIQQIQEHKRRKRDSDRNYKLNEHRQLSDS